MSSIHFKYQDLIFEILQNNISLITCNSSEVKDNAVFIAISGHNNDGTKFIEQAISRGAKIIVSEKAYYQNVSFNNVIYYVVDNSRKFLSYLAAAFYKHKPRYVVAVTGTSGKTSTVNFYQQLMQKLGENSASIGTLGVIHNGQKIDNNSSHLSTPDPIALCSTLERLALQKTKYVALEASSHGIDQYRLESINLHAAAFTNFSQDHLDYHINLEKYFLAKARLFKDIIHNGYVILNSDMKEFEHLRDISLSNNNKIIDYGRNAKVIKILNIEFKNNQQYVAIEIKGKIYKFTTKILGEFQIFNIACALGLIISHNDEIDKLIDLIPELEHINGRMQKVKVTNNSKHIYIDYSHKPEALEKALKLMREINSKGKLLVVFGCGGERDKLKRPIMGKIASEVADLVIITDDNPRNEKPEIIRKEIIAGGQASKIIEISDRKEAIRYAINSINEDDILLIAGKGHENIQIIGDKNHHFNDYDVAFNIVNNILI